MSTNLQHVHFIGIGGIGMSALARFYLHEGVTVSGSDSSESALTKTLAAEGVAVVYEQTAENLAPGGVGAGADLVVYTEAMAHDHPELASAREQGIETINYFEALGRMANQHSLIAVAGTHGKTTTTAMLADIMEDAALDPTVIVGSLRTRTGSNFRAGNSKYALVEACEYKRDFLHLTPDILVITNIEHDHVDYYASLDEVIAAFRELALQVREGGVIIADRGSVAVQQALEGVTAEVIDYRQYIDLSLPLKVPGLHNRQNAAAAVAAARYLDIERAVADDTLEHFAGTWRRFQYKGDVHGAPVYDDYAHHPSAVSLTIKAARELYPHKKVLAVFESHTYSRTKALFAEFVSALALADEVFVLPIYAAREHDDGSVSGEMLAKAVEETGTAARYFHTLDAAALAAREHADADTVILVMGAGKATQVAETLTE